MIFHLPDPVACRVKGVVSNSDEGTVRVAFRDAAQRDAFVALLEKALRGDYAIELRIIHYEGCPDMIEQAKARKAKNAISNSLDG